jgi:invasion protein IalB
MTRLFISCMLVVCLSIGSVGSSLAANNAAPRIFSSWSTQCTGVAAERKCFASQIVSASASGKDVLLGVTVGKLAKTSSTYAMSFRFSNQARQSTGIGFKLEPNGRSARAPIQTCDAKICETKIDLDKAMRQEFEKSKMLSFAFFDNEGRQATYPVRLEGLAEAIAEVEKLSRNR